MTFQFIYIFFLFSEMRITFRMRKRFRTIDFWLMACKKKKNTPEETEEILEQIPSSGGKVEQLLTSINQTVVTKHFLSLIASTNYFRYISVYREVDYRTAGSLSEQQTHSERAKSYI